MMQMSIARNLQAIVDAKTYSEAYSEATKQDNTCETKLGAVECMCKQEAILHREGHREAIHQMDIKLVFLNGLLDEEIFMEPKGGDLNLERG
jgi:hypothetical protein